MKTHDILHTPENELAPKLKNLKEKELDRHGRKLMEKLGPSDFDSILGKLIKSLPHFQQNQFEQVKMWLQEQIPVRDCPHEEEEGIMNRLTIIMVLLITQKFEKIHKGQRELH